MIVSHLLVFTFGFVLALYASDCKRVFDVWRARRERERLNAESSRRLSELNPDFIEPTDRVIHFPTTKANTYDRNTSTRFRMH